MSNSTQNKIDPQKVDLPNQKDQKQTLINDKTKIKENHLSSTAEIILKYQQKNYEIQYATKEANIPQDLIKNQMNVPLQPSTGKAQLILQKYGTMIQNQPIFLRQLIYKNYVPYLPEKFKMQFSQIMVMGGCFEAVWWGSLVFALFRSYRNRHADATFKQIAGKGLGLSCLFIIASLGFHNEIYIPKLKNCFYRNIKSVDSLMDRHIKILQSCGSKIESQTNQNEYAKVQVLQSNLVQGKKQEILNNKNQLKQKK